MTLTDFKILTGIIVVAVGGIWTYYVFLVERTHSPRLELSFNAQCYDFDNEFYLFSTKLKIKNIGKVLLVPTSAQIKLQNILPNTKDFSSMSFDQFNILKAYDEKLLWPMVAQREWDEEISNLQLEPDESEELDTDFFLSKKVKVSRLYGYVHNPESDLGWDTIYTFKVEDICSKGDRDDNNYK